LRKRNKRQKTKDLNTVPPNIPATPDKLDCADLPDLYQQQTAMYHYAVSSYLRNVPQAQRYGKKPTNHK
jgi:hypothetical protein